MLWLYTTLHIIHHNYPTSKFSQNLSFAHNQDFINHVVKYIGCCCVRLVGKYIRREPVPLLILINNSGKYPSREIQNCLQLASILSKYDVTGEL